MENLLVIIGSNWFVIVAVLWGATALANKGKRSDLKDQLSDIITKPAILRQSEGEEQPIYSTERLEQIAKDVADRLITPVASLSQKISNWINSKHQTITSDDKPWKDFGYFIFLIMLVLFFIADAIAIANTLEAIDLLEVVPKGLARYELAVAIGSFFTVIAGGLVARDMFGKSEFSDWDEQHGLWKITAGFIALFLIVSGLLVVIALGLARYRLVVTLPASTDSQLEQIVIIVIFVLVPVNAVLATILIHSEGIKGSQIVFLFGAGILAAAINFWLYIVNIIGAMGVIGLDFIFRALIAMLFIVAFFFFTPLDAVSDVLSSRFSRKKDD